MGRGLPQKEEAGLIEPKHIIFSATLDDRFLS
jgi:hypothetical protein